MIGNSFGFPPTRLKYSPSDVLVLPDTFLGVEVEVEGVRLKPGTKDVYWNITTDGSLRDGGREFVFKEPMFGQDVVSAIDNLLALIKTTGGKASSRTSIHVHLDVRDIPEEALYNLFLLYLVFERAIFNFAGPSRINSHFCVPFFKATNGFQGWSIPFSMQKDLHAFVESVANKYYALNFAALHKFGSIEFRHSEMRLDKEYMLDWLNVILSLKKYALKLDPKLSLPEYISNTGPEEFFFEVFGKELGEKLLYPDAGLDLFEGIRIAQMAVFGNNHSLVEDYYSQFDLAAPSKNFEVLNKKLNPKKKTKGKVVVKKTQAAKENRILQEEQILQEIAERNARLIDAGLMPIPPRPRNPADEIDW